MNLYLAARHWNHEAWSGGFFPADMPEDWRLAYYRNAFQAVVIPRETWDGASEQDAGGWSEDAGEGFAFFLEWAVPDPPVPELAGDAERLVAIVRALGDGFRGLLVPVAAGADPSGLDVLIEVLPPGCPICVLAAAAPEAEALAPRLKGKGPTLAWEDDEGLPRWLGDGPAAVRWRGAAAELPRLRTVIEVLLRAQGNGDAVLMFEGTPPDVETMRAAATIVELLGG